MVFKLENPIKLMQLDYSSQNIDSVLKELNLWLADWIKKLPAEYQETAVEAIDTLVSQYTQAFYHKEQVIAVEKHVLHQAERLNFGVEHIADLQHLSLHNRLTLEERVKQKYGWYALLEGAVVGSGHLLGLLADLPLILAINIKQIHAIGTAHGFSFHSPAEQLCALQVLHAGTLSEQYREDSWEWLKDQFIQSDEYSWFLNHSERVFQTEWLETLAKQWIKHMLLYTIRSVRKSKFSWIGMVIGASSSYGLTTRVGQLASDFYRYRIDYNQGQNKMGVPHTEEHERHSQAWGDDE